MAENQTGLLLGAARGRCSGLFSSASLIVLDKWLLRQSAVYFFLSQRISLFGERCYFPPFSHPPKLREGVNFPGVGVLSKAPRPYSYHVSLGAVNLNIEPKEYTCFS